MSRSRNTERLRAAKASFRAGRDRNVAYGVTARLRYGNGCPDCGSDRCDWCERNQTLRNERQTVDAPGVLAYEASLPLDPVREWSESDDAALCARCEDDMGISCERLAGNACDTFRCPRCGDCRGLGSSPLTTERIVSLLAEGLAARRRAEAEMQHRIRRPKR